MADITITLDDEAIEVLEKRAKKNFLTLKEQIEDIIRKSAIRCKSNEGSSVDVDDRLVSIFSRARSGRKPKKRVS